MKKLVLAVSLVIASAVNVFSQYATPIASDKFVSNIREYKIKNNITTANTDALIHDSSFKCIMKDSIAQSDDIEFSVLADPGIHLDDMMAIVQSEYANKMFDVLIQKNNFFTFILENELNSYSVVCERVMNDDTLFYVFKIFQKS
jgi:hypothetical protein